MRKLFPADGIVVRLRLALGAFVIATLIGAVFIGWRMVQLDEAREQTFEQGLPDLLTTHRATADLAALLDLVVQISDDPSPAQITAIQAHAHSTLTSLEHAGAAIHGQEAETSAALLVRISSAGAAIDRLFAAAASRRTLADQVRTIRARIDAEMTAFQAHVDRVMLDAASALSAAGQGPGAADARLAPLANRLAGFAEIHARTVRIQTLLSVAASERPSASLSDAAGTEFAEIARLLDALPPGPETDAIAANVAALRGHLLASDGLAPLLDRLDLASRDFQTRRQNTSNALQQTARDLARLTGEHERALLDGGRAIGATISGAILSVVLAALIAIVPVLVVDHFVLNRQIGQRMARLTRVVKRVADGEHEADAGPDLSGRDEIAEIAQALEVFRHHAVELERSNANLRAFAHAASHDLRSPLKAIHNLAAWTLEDSGDALPPDGRDNLALIQSRAARLSLLCDDLLAYARSGTGEIPLTTFRVGEVIADAVLLADPEGRFDIRIAAQEGPLRGPEAVVRQVVINLVGNAIKHHDRSTGTIGVSAEISADTRFLRLEISDDGPGIPTSFHDLIFEPFKVLKPRDEVEGSGMGLAIVQQLVRAAGGTITLRSNPEIERGAVFVATVRVVTG